MGVKRHWRHLRVRGALTILIVGLVVTTTPQVLNGQSTVAIETCKKVESRPSVYGSELVLRECGTRFTTADAYIGIVVHLRQFSESKTVAVDLLDPHQTSVWKQTFSIQVDPGRGYSDYWVWAILPIDAHDGMLAAENPALVRARIRVINPLARNRLGDWTVMARVDGGWPISRKFTLVAAP